MTLSPFVSSVTLKDSTTKRSTRGFLLTLHCHISVPFHNVRSLVTHVSRSPVLFVYPSVTPLRHTLFQSLHPSRSSVSRNPTLKKDSGYPSVRFQNITPPDDRIELDVKTTNNTTDDTSLSSLVFTSIFPVSPP